MPTFPLTFPIIFQGTSTPYDVAGDIINQAAAEMGLTPNLVTDPYGSTNPLYFQMRSLLEALGRKLWKLRNWSQLHWVESFVTVAGQGAYPLPDNYGRMLSRTAWNLSGTRGMDALTPESYRAYRARGLSPMAGLDYRIQQQQFQLLTESGTSAGQNIVYEYTSRFWVQTNGQSTPDKDAPTAANDTIWFDPDLVTAGLKARLKMEKGMPGAQDAQDEFDELLALSMETDGAIPYLNLLGGARGPRRIDGYNLPDTLVP